MNENVALLSVLVVEDLKDAANMTADLLRLHGHAVRVAACGAEALRAAEAEMPHAVLLDIGLPDMSGWEVARQLRQIGGARPYIAAVTGYSSERDRLASAKAGIDLHLIKPVAPATLIDLLAWLCGGREGTVDPPPLSGLVRVCAWCQRVFANGEWRVGQPGRYEAISHGMCSSCFTAAMSETN